MKQHGLLILAVILAGFAVYANTFHAPFQWDEGVFLLQNPVVSAGAAPDAVRDHRALYNSVVQRYFGYLTFSWNHRLHGFRVFGYHVVNVAVHLTSAVLVYALVVLAWTTPLLRGSPLRRHSRAIALLCALFFATHPVQTSAVTYVYQRLTSLAACLYLASVTLYAAWRAGREQGYGRAGQVQVSAPPAFDEGPFRSARLSAFLYVSSVVCAVLAMKTKENSVTLPLAIALYEFSFYPGKLRRRLRYFALFLLTLLIIPGTSLLMMAPGYAVGELTQSQGTITPGDYGATQLRVLVTYVRLLLLPIGQNLDYDYPRYHSFLAWPVFLSALFIAGVMGCALLLLALSRRAGAGHLRLISFGIIWFFLTLSVESSVIPLPRVIDEYRLYLPSAGFFLAVITGVFTVLTRERLRIQYRAGLTVLAVLLFCSAYAARARNEQWNSTIVLWEDTVRKSPRKAAPRINLGGAYFRWGRYADALRESQYALTLGPGPEEAAVAHTNAGSVYSELGRAEDAIREFRQALELDPRYAPAALNLELEYRRRRGSGSVVPQPEAADRPTGHAVGARIPWPG